MRRLFSALALGCTIVTAGCYHQVIHSGRPAGSTVIERPWTSTWIFGLVRAEEINTVAECPTGVATVESQRSFANGLVGLLTLGIYTPVSVRITCAASGAALPGSATRTFVVAKGASPEEREAIVRKAIEAARVTGNPTVLRFAR
jgi:hypothetical protein